MEYIIELPPASEKSLKTFASDQRTFCEHSPTFSVPDDDLIQAAVCQISDMKPPLKPNGRMSGSRSKFELVFVIVIFFSRFMFVELYESNGEPAKTPPAIPVAFIKFLLDQFFSVIINRIY